VPPALIMVVSGSFRREIRSRSPWGKGGEKRGGRIGAPKGRASFLEGDYGGAPPRKKGVDTRICRAELITDKTQIGKKARRGEDQWRFDERETAPSPLAGPGGDPERKGVESQALRGDREGGDVKPSQEKKGDRPVHLLRNRVDQPRNENLKGKDKYHRRGEEEGGGGRQARSSIMSPGEDSAFGRADV